MKFAILKNENENSHKYWKLACEKYELEYYVIDILSSAWLDEILGQHFDGCLTCPPGTESLYKKMYDERIYILDKVLKKFVYPSFDEISIHENKKYLAYWLKANKLPHPKTDVFYNAEEAKSFALKCDLPIIGKINIGASGKGVSVIRDRAELKKYIIKAFNKGLKQEWGPNLKMGGYRVRIEKIMQNPKLIFKKIKTYKKLFNEIQKGYVILQEYISHEYEWRVVRIGDSYFGHQKVKHGDKASGTKGIDFVPPPEKLLDFVKIICEKFNFNSMAIDLFEDGSGGYLINEMQCIFGHVQAYICECGGQPGRFIYRDSKWHFEAGMFNTNLSYDLRLENVISILQNKGL
jgi:glutathione synthase/RimK-type ligase-like ATP-grasp enzyme